MVKLELFDTAGRRVRTLLVGELAAGAGKGVWNGRDDAGHGVGSGIYLARFQAHGRQETTKLVLVR